MRHLDRFDQVFRLSLIEAQAGQLMRRGSFVEDTHDHLFAVDGRHGVDAEIDALVAALQRDRAVLRNALFGDVHLRQNLEARNDRNELGARRGSNFVQDAVDPQPNLALVLEWFEVNIARAGGAAPAPESGSPGESRGRPVQGAAADRDAGSRRRGSLLPCPTHPRRPSARSCRGRRHSRRRFRRSCRETRSGLR